MSAKTFHSIQHLLQHLKHYHNLSKEAQDSIASCFHQQVYAKGDHLLKEGKTCKYLYFMQQGAVRGYYNLEGKEVTYWFAFENDFVTSFHSFITQQASIENIQFLEGSIVWAISKDDLDKLLDQYHEIEKLLRIAYEKYYIRLEERFVNAQFKTATERYLELLKQTPSFLNRISLGHIASYLGISQETLSRIRAKL